MTKLFTCLTTASIIFVVTTAIAQESSSRFGNRSKASGEIGDVKADQDKVTEREASRFRTLNKTGLPSAPDKNHFRALGKNAFSKGFGKVTRSTGKTEPVNEQVKNSANRSFDKLNNGNSTSRPKFRGKRTVFGVDDRKQVSKGTRYPFRAFSLFEITYDDWNTYGHCTATLIGESTALTAAHCVYDNEQGAWFDKGDIYPGRTRGKTPFGPYTVEDASVMEGFIENWSGEYDWNVIPFDVAVIKLKGRPGRRLGTIPIGSFSPPKDFVGNIVGYPGDKPYGSMWRSSCDFDTDNIHDVAATHYCDTAPGNSGSSVYDYESRDRSRTIVAVDVAGSNESQVAIHLNGAYFQWICSAVRDFEGRDICP